MIHLRPGAGIGPLLCYLRGHAEAVASEGRQDPALGATLLLRCFGAHGRGFSYKRERRGRDEWWGVRPALQQLVCNDWVVYLDGQPSGPVCTDCEDQTSYFAAAALISGVYEWVDVGIIPPPHSKADGHAVARVGPVVAASPPGLDMPSPGIWDPSAWTGMQAPPAELYSTAQFLRLRELQ
jgi:hypothetical protein